MTTTWEIKPADPTLTSLAETFRFTPTALQILWSRGLRSMEAIEHFLNADESRLIDPFLLPGMDKACARIFHAVKSGELIMIHGDYDVDGVTAAAIMVHTLRKLGAEFLTYVPHRKNGYGFNEFGLRFAAEKNVKLILTLDCGITSKEVVAEARAMNIDTVIVDHHQIPSSGAPECAAVVNPWLDPAASESFLELSAAGLAFKLSAALVGEEAFRWLDIASVGTVADVAPLSGENRIIVKSGLKFLSGRSHIGLAELMKRASLKSQRVTARHIGFVIGPRLNAGGRMETGEDALRILTTDSPSDARMLAQVLEERNDSRRKTEKQMLKEAIEQCEREVNFNRDRIIVVWNEAWHPGVIGIIAARLVDRYYRPAVVISLDHGRGKGSGRSIRNFNIYQALKAASSELVEFGGHEFAAGLVIDENNLVSFRKAMNEYGIATIRPEHLSRPIDIDAEIPLTDISAQLVNEVMSMAPFGSGNPEPVFMTRRLRLKQAPASEGRYQKRLWVTDGTKVFQALAKAEMAENIATSDEFDLVYSLSIESWQGQEILSLEVKDVKWSK